MYCTGQTPATESRCMSGRDGIHGRDGRDGRSGTPGTPGFPGFPGQKGEVGEEGMKGDTGMKGNKGSPSETTQSTGGVTYIRWGRSACRNGTTRVYEGRAGGTYGHHGGGASNYLCMPDTPEYILPYRSGTQDYGYVYGVEYEFPLTANRNQHNAPCALCYVSNKETFIMIPGKYNCPSGWMKEYSGYLMSERASNHRSEYVCVDSYMESVDGSQAQAAGAHWYHVEANCHGIACPPYNNHKELNCVVCTK